MFAFADVFHFLAHKFACLGGRRFAFPFVFTRSLDWFFFRHSERISPPVARLDVTIAGVFDRMSEIYGIKGTFIQSILSKNF